MGLFHYFALDLLAIFGSVEWGVSDAFFSPREDTRWNCDFEKSKVCNFNGLLVFFHW